MDSWWCFCIHLLPRFLPKTHHHDHQDSGYTLQNIAQDQLIASHVDPISLEPKVRMEPSMGPDVDTWQGLPSHMAVTCPASTSSSTL